MRYRKKPVIVEAVQWTGDVESFQEIQALNPDAKLFPQWKSDTIAIPTLEGELTADLGDYIVKGDDGELYPCKPDIFKQTCEKLSDLKIKSPSREVIEIAKTLNENHEKQFADALTNLKAERDVLLAYFEGKQVILDWWKDGDVCHVVTSDGEEIYDYQKWREGCEPIYDKQRERIKQLEALVHDCLTAHCHVCADYMDEHPCPHIEDSGCGLLRRMKELGVKCDMEET